MAKKTSKNQVVPVEADGPDARPSSVRAYLADKSAMIDGLENIGPGKTIKMVVTGEVRSFSSYDWEPGAELEVIPTSVAIETEDEEITLDDAISGAAVRV